MAQFALARDTTRAVAEIVRPSRRMLPSEAAAEFKLRDKEGKEWSPDVAPYMVDPLDALASRRYKGIVFVGPARTSKTFSLIHGGLNYIVTCAPGDTTVVQSSQDTARDLSKFEFDPVVRNSVGLRERISPRAQDNNTFDKIFRSGMVVKFGWPAVSQLSGNTRRNVFLPDYDRPENRDNVDGEGPLWDLAYKRIQTYMSRGKCLAESSPGEDFVDASWAPVTPHQAPPARGILSLYNQGTMGRFYWACQGCGARFQVTPGWSVFDIPEFKELADQVQTSDLHGLAQEHARIVCKNGCGFVHEMQHRRQLNTGGQWLHEFERFDKHDRPVGNRIETDIVSFWLGGAAAAFQRWDSMLLGYFEKVREWTRTGDESGMRTKTNVDAGAPYMPRSAANRRKAEDLIKRAEVEKWTRGTVPKGVRFLIGAVDIQANRFVVSIYGFGADRERWLVDRFDISQSKRMDGDRPALVDPATYDEDWDLLIDEVILRSYPLEEDPDLRMPVFYSHCDSGGAASAHGVGGVTHRAYEFWRRLARQGIGNKFRLVKGANSFDAKRLEERWPDAKNEKDKMFGARGDVPVWFINTTTFKDAMFGDLNRDAPGPGYVHLPHWLDRKIFAEYVAEARGAQGWKKKPGQRNEQGDLHVYADAAYAVLGAEKINWDNPPEWARRPTRSAEASASEDKPVESEWARRARLLNDR